MISTKTLKPILFLLVFPSLMGEIFISGGSPITALLNPATWFWFTLSYGIPVLFIREVWVRSKLNILAMLVWGVAYSIFNEGIIAQTLTQLEGDPAGAFIGYGTVFGIHLSWATFILTFHALFSVFMPILLAHFFFPDSARVPWLGKKVFTIVVILAALNYLFYFAGGLVPNTNSVWHFTVYLAATVIIAAIGIGVGRLSVAKKRPEGQKIWPLIVSGLFLPALFYFVSFLAPLSGLPATLFISIGWGLLAWLCIHAYRNQWLSGTRFLVFLLPSSMGFSIMVALVTTSAGLLTAINSAIYSAFGIITMIAVVKKSRIVSIQTSPE